MPSAAGVRAAISACATACSTRWSIWCRSSATPIGRKISLVGWSLGGLYARQLAKMMPDRVRSVITLGSPFAGSPKATNAWRVYEMASGRRADEDDRRFGGSLAETPPVPTTAIFSRTDGICAWQGCMEKPSAPLREHRGRKQPLRHGPSSRRGLCGGRPSGAARRQMGAVRPQRLAQHRLSGSRKVSRSLRLLARQRGRGER